MREYENGSCEEPRIDADERGYGNYNGYGNGNGGGSHGFTRMNTDTAPAGAEPAMRPANGERA